MPELTVATFNIWGFGEPWRYTQERGEVRGAVPGSLATTLRPPEGTWSRRRPLLAVALAKAGAEIIGLQEALFDASDSLGRTQAEELAADLGYESVSLAQSGLAILSRHPVCEYLELAIPNVDEEAPTGYGALSALHAVIDGPAGVLDFLVAHFTPRSAWRRTASAGRLRGYVNDLPLEHTPVLVGDFNAGPEDQSLGPLLDNTSHLASRQLRDAWATAHPDDPGATMPSHFPRTSLDRPMRFDYILVGPGPEILESLLLGAQPDSNGFYASDHLGVATTLRWS